MQTYVASPTRTAPVTDEHPLFRFDVSPLVCSAHPIKMVVLGDTRWTSMIHVDMTDAELDQLIEFATVARKARRGQKATTLASLAESEYEDGSISMETAERLQSLAGEVIGDRKYEAPVFEDVEDE